MGDYYSEYRHFDLYAKQTDSVAKGIKDLGLKAQKKPFILVDVGCNDGELTERVMEGILTTNKSIHTYAFEPDSAAYRNLQRRCQSHENIQTDNLDFQGWVTEYMSELQGKVDLALNSHTFYHFPKQTWKQVIEQGAKLLSPTGNHIIIIDSERTSINGLKEELEEMIGSQKKTGEYGELLDGNGIEMFLKTSRMPYEHLIIDQPITIPESKESLQNLARIVGFVFRYEPDDVVKYAGDQLRRFMDEYKEGREYKFPRSQDMFILKT